MISFVKSLCVELAKRDITVNCVAPGLTESEGLDVYPAYYAQMGPANAAGPQAPGRRTGATRTTPAACVACSRPCVRTSGP